ncbi:13165_t:CDS:1 [Cetraspora pellucida]|uniref:13165_t:CDS:1 n=1 Tax=Cetraspora pellucida TaxID=1433469 RepID=A0ACA9KPA7_9GLOM|nr:13165_t:CDS:1 [Cetraspora pellucida]
MSLIPVEILRLVFGLLSKDKKSLRSCLLVDRTWCESVVSILWNDPFQFLDEPSSLIIRTLLSCLNESEPESTILKKEEFTIENLLMNRPTFDYVAFMRHLKYVNIYESTLVWLTQEGKDTSLGFFVARELCKLIIKRCKTILTLSISTEGMVSFTDENDYVSIPCFPGAPDCLSNLQEFMCCGAYDKKKIFKSMANSCRNIRRLYVDYYMDDLKTAAPPELAKLIKNQQGLIEFKLTMYAKVFDIVSALGSQEKTLSYVEFRGIDFGDDVTFDSLVNCTNLKYLSLHSCDNVTNKTLEPLTTVSFPNLKTFIFKVIPKPPVALSSFIRSNCISLQELVLEWQQITDPEDDPEIVETIIEYCPNITSFEGHLKVPQQLVPFLQACSQLRNLTVHGKERVVADELLPQLGPLIPAKMSKLNICAIWTFTPSALQEFLDLCIAPLEFIGIRECYDITDEHLDIIARYAEKGSLKYLNIKAASRITKEGLENICSVVDVIEHSDPS